MPDLLAEAESQKLSDEILTRADGTKPLNGVFHSILGVFALRLAARGANPFATLVLLEPPVPAPSAHPLFETRSQRQAQLAARARRRRNRFDSVEKYADRMRDRTPFRFVDAPALMQLARGILRPGDDGGFTLRCPREFEALVYETNLDRGLRAALAQTRLRAFVISSDESGLRRAIDNDLTSLCGLDHTIIPQATHLLPLEHPRTLTDMALDHFTGWDANS